MSNEEIFQTMKDLVSEQFGMELDEVTLETSFEDDLGADSVDLVELVMAMEEEFELGQTAEEMGFNENFMFSDLIVYNLSLIHI